MAAVRNNVEARFRRFRDQATEFSRDLVRDYRYTRDPYKSADLNLQVTKAILGKWSVQIFSTLYAMKSAGFEDLRKSVPSISSRVLSDKLKLMEDQSFVQRSVFATRPPHAEYALTEKGLAVAELGTPLLLYLRHTEGLL